MDEISAHEKVSQRKKSIVQLWEGTGLLRGIEGALEKEQVAILLENQRQANEILGEAVEEESVKALHNHMMRVSIPIVRRAYDPSSFIGFSLASVQSMMASEHSFVYRDLYGNIRTRAIVAKSSSMQLPPRATGNRSNLDEEADICAKYAGDLTHRMNQEVVGDIRRNAPTVSDHRWKNRDDFEGHVRMTMGRVEKQSGRAPNWVLTTRNLVAELLGQEQGDREETRLPVFEGMLGNKKVFSFSGCKEGVVLLGHKGDLYTSGYFYCPHIAMLFAPIDPKLKSGLYDPKAYARYGKAMPFPEFYGRIQVHGYSSNEKEAENVG